MKHGFWTACLEFGAQVFKNVCMALVVIHVTLFFLGVGRVMMTPDQTNTLTPQERMGYLNHVELSGMELELEADRALLRVKPDQVSQMSVRVMSFDGEAIRKQAMVPGEQEMEIPLAEGDMWLGIYAGDNMILGYDLEQTAEGWVALTDARLLSYLRRVEQSWCNNVLSTPSEEMVALSREIVGDETDPSAKVQLIHDWICENIYYRDGGIGNFVPLVSAERVAKTRVTQCGGYSALFQDLCHAQSIPCRMMFGYGGDGCDGVAESVINGSLKRYLYLQKHGWNEVWLDGKWQMVDTTWDSSNKYYGGLRHEFRDEFVAGNYVGQSFIFLDPVLENDRHLPYCGVEIPWRFVAAPSEWARDDILNGITDGLVTPELMRGYHLAVSRGELAQLMGRLLAAAGAESGEMPEGLETLVPVTMEEAAAAMAETARHLGMVMEGESPLTWCQEQGLFTDEADGLCSRQQAMSAAVRLLELVNL